MKLCHRASSESGSEAKTPWLWGNPAPQTWNSELCEKLLSASTSDPLLKILPHPSLWVQQALPRVIRRLWSDSLGHKNVSVIYSLYQRAQLLSSESHSNAFKRKQAVFSHPTVPSSSTEIQLLLCWFLTIKQAHKWAVFPGCYRKVSALRLPLIKQPGTLIFLYHSLPWKWVSWNAPRYMSWEHCKGNQSVQEHTRSSFWAE